MADLAAVRFDNMLRDWRARIFRRGSRVITGRRNADLRRADVSVAARQGDRIRRNRTDLMERKGREARKTPAPTDFLCALCVLRRLEVIPIRRRQVTRRTTTCRGN